MEKHTLSPQKNHIFVAIIIIISVILVIACIRMIYTSTPEYMLTKIAKDINEQGISGLYPHLTNRARKTFDTIAQIMENDFFSPLISLLSMTDYWDTANLELQKVQWELRNIAKNKDHADVSLAFHYSETVSGTLEFSMVRDAGEWKIEDFNLPKFDQPIW